MVVRCGRGGGGPEVDKEVIGFVHVRAHGSKAGPSQRRMRFVWLLTDGCKGLL
jgi:hypothetical protein